VNLAVVTPNFPGGDGWVADADAGVYSLELSPGVSAAVSLALLLGNLEEDGWAVVEIEASDNYGSTQTRMTGATLYSSEPVQKFYFDSDEGSSKNLTFHARVTGGCTVTATVKLGQFQEAVSAFGSSAAVTIQ
jgi:hypothetical protein